MYTYITVIYTLLIYYYIKICGFSFFSFKNRKANSLKRDCFT